MDSAAELDKDLSEANAKPLLTIKEAADFSRVHPRTVRRWIAAGALSTVGARAGGSSRVLIRRKNLAALLAGLNT